ncbi:MAG: M12 family metallopeptidase, partial [Cyanobacteriota bacterium]
MIRRHALFALSTAFAIAATSSAKAAQFFLFPLRSGIWESTNIATCWENPSTENTSERLAVQQAVRATWERNSALRFIGWAACSNNSDGIRILINDEGPHVKALGRHLNGVRNGMVLNFTYENWSPTCKQRRQFCNEVIAVHEFGHALGFAHEQNKPDAPDWCREQRQGSDGDMFITPFDLDSVMNYCNPSWSGNGVLSALDMAGLNQLYGTPRQRFGFDFALQVPTVLHQTGDNFAFAFMANGDLMAIKKSGTGSGSTEVHILSAASNYSKFRLQTGTALHQ